MFLRAKEDAIREGTLDEARRLRPMCQNCVIAWLNEGNGPQRLDLKDSKDSDRLRYRGMTRFAFKAIDLGASAVFMALCIGAFCIHFYKDIERARALGEHHPSCRTALQNRWN
jgi:hypothetical protein